MNYEKLINRINNEETGIAKGYDIGFLQNLCVYEKNGEEIFDNLINRDLKLFNSIESEILESKEPQEGDFVEYADGMFARISRIHSSDTLQLSNQIGVYVSKGGFSQASGCTWDSSLDKIKSDRLTISNLLSSSKTKKGECWTFSDQDAGANRGVYYNIKFKVWALGQ